MFSTRANRAWFEFTSRERHLSRQSRLQHIEVDADVFAVGGGVLVGAGRGEAEVLACEIDEADPIEGSWEEVFLGIKRSPLRGDDDVFLKDGARKILRERRVAGSCGRGYAIVVVRGDVVLKDEI